MSAVFLCNVRVLEPSRRCPRRPFLSNRSAIFSPMVGSALQLCLGLLNQVPPVNTKYKYEIGRIDIKVAFS